LEGKAENPDPYVEIFSCPANYVPSRFFTAYMTGFVAPLYRNTLSEIKRESSVDTIRLWGWAFDKLAEKVGIRTGVGQFPNYTNDLQEGNIVCATSPASEIYISSYLRVLAALEYIHTIDRTTLRRLSAQACPVDFSFWRIAYSACPPWWPLHPDTDGIDTLVAWADIRSLALKPVDGGKLIFVEGALPAKLGNPLQDFAFRLTPFGYRVVGPEIPDPVTVAMALRRPEWTVNAGSRTALSTFGTPLSSWEPEDQHLFVVGDLRVVPLLAAVQPVSANCWQIGRGTHPPAFPSIFLADGGAPSFGNDSWVYEERGEAVFVGKDWLSGPIGRVKKTAFVQHGQFAAVNYGWLDRTLAANHYKLAFVGEHSYRVRKDEHSEPKTSGFYEYVGLETVISPRV
jgi:hypothetical protein